MTIIERIVELAKPHLQAFESDLEHDRQWIAANRGADFIHVTRATGTHIIGLPEAGPLVANTPEPHLFGVARPSEIYQRHEEMLKGMLRTSGRLWLLCEDGVVKKSNPKRCLNVYRNRLRIAQRDADRTRAGGVLGQVGVGQ